MTLSEAYRTAVQMQIQFAGEAAHVAAERADACLRVGDAAGFDDWNRVCAMLKELERMDLQAVH